MVVGHSVATFLKSHCIGSKRILPRLPEIRVIRQFPSFGKFPARFFQTLATLVAPIRLRLAVDLELEPASVTSRERDAGRGARPWVRFVVGIIPIPAG